MAMTKKEFIRLAEYLQPDSLANYCRMSVAKSGETTVVVNDLLEHLANFCHEQNPNFKRQRWIGYIKGENGPSGGKR